MSDEEMDGRSVSSSEDMEELRMQGSLAVQESQAWETSSPPASPSSPQRQPEMEVTSPAPAAPAGSSTVDSPDPSRASSPGTPVSREGAELQASPSPSHMSPLSRPSTPLRSPYSSVGGTPLSRGELGHNVSHLVPRGHAGGDEDGEEEGERVLIFGTSVDIYEQMALFRAFLRNFTGPQGEKVYERKLEKIYETGEKSFDIDCEDLESHSPESLKVYKNLVLYPIEMIPVLDLGVHQEYCGRYGEDALEEGQRIQVRTFNLHKVKRMRSLDPGDLEQMVALRGMVIRVSPVIPDLKQALFRCERCGAEKEVDIDRGVIQEPKECEKCERKFTMRLIHNRCLFADKQMVKLQEAPENIPEGETPQTISIYAYDSLVDAARPGDRVEVTGIFRAVATKKNPMRRVLGSTYKTYLDVLHFRKLDKSTGNRTRNRRVNGLDERDVSRGVEDTASEGDNRMEEEDREEGEGEGRDIGRMTEEEKRRLFEEMSRDPNLYEKLAHSVAPSIWELDDIKKGVLLLLFGGTNKEMERAPHEQVRTTHRMRARGEINILLCGDPGTSKSQILGYVHKLAPRGIYTSGKGSSAVGLTAYVTKDPETKEVILESGALVLSDRGVCCIDEFDKMSDSTRAILHECMEQQTISVAKAGIIATLNARTSILASANPVESRYNPRLSMVQNIKLPPTLLSRFDLIYLVLDKPDVVTDRRLAKHLVQLYFRNPPVQRPTFDRKLVTEYIAFAKRNCSPQIGDNAVRKLVQGYVEMRQLGALGGGKKTISATPRQLESLIRLSEARAKVRLSPVVTEGDVDEALRLMHVATQRSAVDPRTGTIDMDAITTGIGSTDRTMQETLAAEILSFVRENFASNEGVRLFSLVRHMNEQSSQQVTQEQVARAIQALAEDNHVEFNAQTGLVRVIQAA